MLWQTFDQLARVQIESDGYWTVSVNPLCWDFGLEKVTFRSCEGHALDLIKCLKKAVKAQRKIERTGAYLSDDDPQMEPEGTLASYSS